MKLFTLIFFSFLILSCNSSKEKEGEQSDSIASLKDEIKTNEDNISALSVSGATLQQIDSCRSVLVKSLINFYKLYPADEFAPVCLDRVHFSYSAERKYELAAMFADTLLLKYPDYINRAMLLESQANTFDMLIVPRDTSKVRYYSELLIKENPELPKEKVSDIEFRLDNLELTIEEIMEMQLEELN